MVLARKREVVSIDEVFPRLRKIPTYIQPKLSYLKCTRSHIVFLTLFETEEDADMSDKIAEATSKNTQPEAHRDNLDEFRGGVQKQSTRAKEDAKRILNLAADEMSPWRDPMMSSRDTPPLQPLKTLVRDEMAKLNEDPARLEAALKVMTNQPKDHKVDVTVSKDANGAEKVTFDRPGTEHYLPSSQSFNVLSAGEEKGIQRIAKLMAGSQDTLPIDHLRALANAVKSYGSHGYDLDRGLTNFGYELSKNPATKSIIPDSPGLMTVGRQTSL